MLDYVPQDAECQGVVGMCDLLRDLYTEQPPRGELQVAKAVVAYHAHCCQEACQSNYLIYLEADVTEALANAPRSGVWFAALLRV